MNSNKNKKRSFKKHFKNRHIQSNVNVFNNAIIDFSMYLGPGNIFQSIIDCHSKNMMNNVQSRWKASINDPYKKPIFNKLAADPIAIRIFELMNSKITKKTVNELKTLISLEHVKFIKKYIINGRWETADRGDSIVLYRVENESIVMFVDTRKYSYKIIKKLI